MKYKVGDCVNVTAYDKTSNNKIVRINTVILQTDDVDYGME